MATLLDLGLLSNFSNIFIFLFVFVVVYGILAFTNPFGNDKKPLYAMISIVVAVLLLFSANAMKLISFLVPWFIIMAIIIFFILMIVKFFGTTDEGISQLIKHPAVHGVLITIIVVVIIIGFATLFGQKMLQREDLGGDTPEGEEGATEGDSFESNIYEVVFHPKVLGLIVIMLIAVVAMVMLTKNSA